jgi:hypothetical protein
MLPIRRLVCPVHGPPWFPILVLAAMPPALLTPLGKVTPPADLTLLVRLSLLVRPSPITPLAQVIAPRPLTLP